MFEVLIEYTCDRYQRLVDVVQADFCINNSNVFEIRSQDQTRLYLNMREVRVIQVDPQK